jgi:hypothetical protein
MYKFKRFYSKVPKGVKKEYELTEEQKEVLIGLMLADGSLERERPSFTTRLRVDHSYPEQEAYVLYLYNIFSLLIGTEPAIAERKLDSRTGKVYKSIHFKTLRFSCLNEYHELFYENKTKVVPQNIENLLTPRGVAHLIMGDI